MTPDRYCSFLVLPISTKLLVHTMLVWLDEPRRQGPKPAGPRERQEPREPRGMLWCLELPWPSLLRRCCFRRHLSNCPSRYYWPWQLLTSTMLLEHTMPVWLCWSYLQTWEMWRCHSMSTTKVTTNLPDKCCWPWVQTISMRSHRVRMTGVWSMMWLPNYRQT